MYEVFDRRFRLPSCGWLVPFIAICGSIFLLLSVSTSDEEVTLRLPVVAPRPTASLQAHLSPLHREFQLKNGADHLKQYGGDGLREPQNTDIVGGSIKNVLEPLSRCQWPSTAC